MSIEDILTLAIGTTGAAVALGTLVAACLEYVRQGKMARVRMFFDLRNRLKEPDLSKLAELIDEAAAPDPAVSRKAREKLQATPFRIKRDYLGLFEEVDLAMQWGLIEPDVAHYMFGYYALHCANCPSFWADVGRWNPYWDRFHRFCERMEAEREAFERRRGGEERIDFAPVSRHGSSAAAVSAGGAADAEIDVWIDLPPPLRHRAEGKKKVRARARTVGEALLGLADSHPAVGSEIFVFPNGPEDLEAAELRRYVNVYYDGIDIRFGDGFDTVLREGEEIVILPAVSGG